MKKILSTSLLSLLFILQGQAQPESSLLWKIQSPGGQTSYLFGTYHLVGSDYLNTHKKVEEAYKNAQTVVVETVIDSSQLMQVAMISLMPEHSLKELVNSADYELLREEIKEVTGADLALFDKVKPMALSAMYAMALAQEATPVGLSQGGQPIDLYFAANGKKTGKKVVPLETMLEQAEILFGSSPVEEQAHSLVQMVKEKDTGEDLTEEIIRSYEEEDLNRMWELTDTLGDAYGDMALLVDDRNQKWVPLLKPLLDEGNTFVAVGALHLPGAQGLIALLRKEGYQVIPVK